MCENKQTVRKFQNLKFSLVFESTSKYLRICTKVRGFLVIPKIESCMFSFYLIKKHKVLSSLAIQLKADCFVLFLHEFHISKSFSKFSCHLVKPSSFYFSVSLIFILFSSRLLPHIRYQGQLCIMCSKMPSTIQDTEELK